MKITMQQQDASVWKGKSSGDKKAAALRIINKQIQTNLSGAKICGTNLNGFQFASHNEYIKFIRRMKNEKI